MNTDKAQEQIPYTQLYERWIKQKARAEKAETELAEVDALLARRTALDDLPTRCEKIGRAISVASKAENLED